MSVSASSASSFAAGIGAFVLTNTGVSSQALFWAFLGAVIGLTAAVKAGRLLAVGIFIAVIFGCALLGTALSAEYFKAAEHVRNAFAFFSAVFFHPATTIVVSHTPKFVKGVAAKFGINYE